MINKFKTVRDYDHDNIFHLRFIPSLVFPQNKLKSKCTGMRQAKQWNPSFSSWVGLCYTWQVLSLVGHGKLQPLPLTRFQTSSNLGVIIDPLAPHTCNCKRIVLPLGKVQRGLSLAPFEPIDSVVAKSLTL